MISTGDSLARRISRLVAEMEDTGRQNAAFDLRLAAPNVGLIRRVTSGDFRKGFTRRRLRSVASVRRPQHAGIT